jgi:frataxin-like iron-binding protein CyaY
METYRHWKIHLAAGLALLFWGCGVSNAQTQFWKPLSLGGGSVYSALTVNNQVWIATPSGIYCSEAPEKGWILQQDTVSMRQFFVQLHAGPNGTVFAHNQRRVYQWRAESGWVNITQNLPLAVIKSIVYIKGAGLFAHFEAPYLFRLHLLSETDLQRNNLEWKRVFINDIEPDYSKISLIYRDSFNRLMAMEPEQNRLYIWQDSGKTWKTIQLPLKDGWLEAPRGYCLGSGKAGNILFASTAGIWETQDKLLNSWQKLGNLTLPQGDSITCVGYLPNQKIYFAATTLGVIWRISNPSDSTSWTPWFNTAQPEIFFTSFFAPNQQELWFTSENSGIWAYVYKDSVWRSRNEGLANVSITAVAATPGVYYAKQNGGSLWSSFDEGKTWKPAKLPNPQVNCFLTVRDSIWAGVSGQGGVWRSFDGGNSWQRAERWPDIGAKQLCKGASGELFALSILGRIWRSTDGGSNWREFPLQGIEGNNLLCLHCNEKGQLFVGIQGKGVFEFLPSKGKWQPLGKKLTSSEALALLTNHEGKLMAATAESIFIYDLAAQDWELSFTPPKPPIALLQVPGDTVVLATLGAGVWFRTGSANWQPINEGLGSLIVRNLTLTPKNEILAGTDRGVYRSPQLRIARRPLLPINSAITIKTIKAYPNPAQNYLEITSAKTLPANVFIEFISTRGALAKRVCDKASIGIAYQQDYTISVQIPQDLDNGMYYLLLRDAESPTHPIIIVLPVVIQR